MMGQVECVPDLCNCLLASNWTDEIGENEVLLRVQPVSQLLYEYRKIARPGVGDRIGVEIYYLIGF